MKDLFGPSINKDQLDIQGCFDHKGITEFSSCSEHTGKRACQTRTLGLWQALSFQHNGVKMNLNDDCAKVQLLEHIKNLCILQQPQQTSNRHIESHPEKLSCFVLPGY